MRRLLPYLVVPLVYIMTPGAGELTDNFVHLLVTGHTAHGISDADHTPDDAEHGCSAAFHVCVCHASASLIVVASGLPASVSHSCLGVALDTSGAIAAGYAGRIFRPPTA